MPAFQWDDPFLLDDQLNEEESMIRDSAKAFAAAELQTRVEDMYMNEGVEPGLFRLMGQAGMLGVTIPEQYGGVGASYVSYGLVAREIERVDSGYRSMASVQSSIAPAWSPSAILASPRLWNASEHLGSRRMASVQSSIPPA